MIPGYLLAAPAHKVWNLPQWLTPDPERIGVNAARLVLTLLAAWLVQRLFFLLVRRGEQWLVRAARETGHGVQRARTIGQILRHAVTAVVGAWACVHTLEILGWDVKPLLVGASILGAALGFGAQFLVRDVIAGTFIFIEDQFVVGDLIEVNGQSATVEAVTLRSTRLRDFNGRELHVPNGEMKIVVNHSRGWNRAVVDLPVAPGQDLVRVLQITGAVITELNADPAWRHLLVDPFVVMGIERVGPEGAHVRVAARARPGGDAARL
ncbi:MAG TPA: mechanosensitive ion channel domain-containing protein, partial [Candidatus Eisenbacteria bacterium]